MKIVTRRKETTSLTPSWFRRRGPRQTLKPPHCRSTQEPQTRTFSSWGPSALQEGWMTPIFDRTIKQGPQ